MHYILSSVIVLSLIMSNSFCMKRSNQDERQEPSKKVALNNAMAQLTQPMAHIIQAVRDGNIELVKECLKRYPVSVLDYIACKSALDSGRPEFIKMLVQAGFLTQGHDGSTALMHAVFAKDMPVIKALIASGINVNIENKNGQRALSLAVMQNYAEIVELLLRSGATPNFTFTYRRHSNSCSETPLICSIINKNKAIAKMLIASNADVNASDNDNRTPLDLTIFELDNDEELINLLLDNGADASQDSDILAGYINKNQKANAETVRKFLDAGADVLAPDENIRRVTALHHAAARGNLEILNALVEHESDVSSVLDRDYDENPMMTAIMRNHKNIVQRLMQLTSSDNQKLLGAAYLGDTELIKTLLDAGADINVVTHWHATPLILAAEQRHVEAVKTLIERGTGIDETDERKVSALGAAARNEHSEMVHLLIKAGSKDLDKALAYAVKKNKLKTALILLAAGADIQKPEAHVEVHTYADANKVWSTGIVRKNVIELAQMTGNKDLIDIMNLCAQEQVRHYLKDPKAFTQAFIAAHFFTEVNVIECNPVQLACIFNHADIVKLIKEAGEQYPHFRTLFNTRDKHKRTPLMYAIICENYALIQELLSLKTQGKDGLESFVVEVDKRDKYDNTALYYAVKAGDIKLVNALLSRGAKVQTKCIELASRLQNKQMMMNLLFASAKTYGALVNDATHPKADAKLPRLFNT